MIWKPGQCQKPIMYSYMLCILQTWLVLVWIESYCSCRTNFWVMRIFLAPTSLNGSYQRPPYHQSCQSFLFRNDTKLSANTHTLSLSPVLSLSVCLSHSFCLYILCVSLSLSTSLCLSVFLSISVSSSSVCLFETWSLSLNLCLSLLLLK